MQTSPVSMYLVSQCQSVKYSTRSAYPQARNKHATCLHDNCVYMYAGKDGNISLKDFWRFYIGSSKWEKVSFRGDIPQHLEGHTLVSSKKLMLLFGGEFGDAHTESSLWVINPDLNFIRKICLDPGSARPSVRRQHSAVVFHHSMYVYGGYVDVQGSSSQLWRYHIDDEDWELLPQGKQNPDSPGGRYGHSAVVYNKQMWLYGGMTDLQPKQDLWRYTFSSGRWEKLKSKYGPPPLTGHSAVVAGSTMILFGGESSREPVNQLWCFCFKTEKWTQIIPKDVIPSGRTCHSAIFLYPALHQEDNVRACSMPYLQRKLQKMSNGQRPRSSPGYRSQAPNEGFLNSAFERTVSMEENNVKSNRQIQCGAGDVKSHTRCSVESLKIGPSLSENAKEELPLCPDRTDFNYNLSEMLNKNAVIMNGIDNPGISKSTEELINESRQKNTLGCGDSVSNTYNSSDNGNPNPCLFNNESVSKVSKYQRQNTDGMLRVGPNVNTYIDVSNQLSRQYAKTCRLDLNQHEHIDQLDCLPNQVQISYPSRYSSSLLGTSSGESPVTDPDGLETIILEDYFPHPQNKSHPDRDSSIARQEIQNDTVRYSKDEGKVYLPDSSKHDQSTASSLDVQPSGHDTINNDNVEGTDEMETRFQPENHFIVQSEVNTGASRHYTRNPLPKSAKKTLKVESPYMLILGGKDHESPPFSSKPLPLWKFNLIQASV